MARHLRLHVPGGFHHVTLRGNHQQPIFFYDSDRDLLDSIVDEVVTAQGARVHAFCWMTNHLHALIQVSEVPLGRIILRIASRYARLVQSRMSTTGHLFERRYHSVLVDEEEYLLTLVRYIHLNPVHAGLVQDPGQYQWSSHRDYLGQSQRRWVTTGSALRLLALDGELAVARYRDFMADMEPSRWGEAKFVPNVYNAQILGNDDFTARITGRCSPLQVRVSIAELLEQCSKRFAVTPELLSSPSKSRRLAVARAWFAHEATAARAATVCAVARLFQRSESSIRELMLRYPREGADGVFQIRESATRHRSESQTEMAWISGRQT